MTGKPPFNGFSDAGILKSVLAGKPNYDLPVFKRATSNCKDILQKMLEPNVKLRNSAQDCLKHDWFKKQSELFFTPQNAEENMQIENTLGAMKDFRGKLKMQQAALNLIQTNFINNEELRE